MTYPEAIAKRMEAMSVTPNLLAQTVGIAPRKLKRFLAGEQDIPLEQLVAICRQLGLTELSEEE